MGWDVPVRVLRVSHSAVVDAWRDRERSLRALGHTVHLLSARTWNEGGVDVPLTPRPGEDVVGVRTWGRHPALFVYDPARSKWGNLSALAPMASARAAAMASVIILTCSSLARARVLARSSDSSNTGPGPGIAPASSTWPKAAGDCGRAANVMARPMSTGIVGVRPARRVVEVAEVMSPGGPFPSLQRLRAAGAQGSSVR